MNKPSSLYVHIPFCAHICAYCDFPKVLRDERWESAYLDALEKELDGYAISSLRTIYVGGGTPTSLSLSGLERLLRLLGRYRGSLEEYTFESNPETASEEKLALLHRYGVNRISFGVESSSPRLLSLMGRKHSFEEARRAIGLAKAAGFSNISADIIYGLPDESLEEAEADARASLSLDVDHLSAYCLSVHPGTSFYNEGYREMDDETAAEQLESIIGIFASGGYERYEVSNFARNGKKSSHNLVYWHNEEYYGAGLGASGYVEGVRYDNTRSLSRYLKGEYRENEEAVSKEDAIKYHFLTNLRLKEGFGVAPFVEAYGREAYDKRLPAFKRLEAQGLLELSEGRVRPTDRGLMLLDRVLIELF